jgi:hypothetical protein
VIFFANPRGRPPFREQRVREKQRKREKNEWREDQTSFDTKKGELRELKVLVNFVQFRSNSKVCSC